MESVKVTLYELFGYILPGMPLLFVIHFGLAAFATGNCYFSDSLIFIAGNLLLAYLLGHAVQSVGNIFSSKCEFAVLEKSLQKLKTSSEAHQIVVGEDLKGPYSILHNIALSAKYKTQVIDTYIEREGFYRGSLVSSTFAFVVLLISFFGKNVTLAVKDADIVVGNYQRIAFSIVLFALAMSFSFRYMRFLRYRINSVLDATRNVNQ